MCRSWFCWPSILVDAFSFTARSYLSSICDKMKGTNAQKLNRATRLLHSEVGTDNNTLIMMIKYCGLVKPMMRMSTASYYIESQALQIVKFCFKSRTLVNTWVPLEENQVCLA